MGKRVSGITGVRGYVRLMMVTLNLRRRDGNYKETELVSSQLVITMAQKTVLIKGYTDWCHLLSWVLYGGHEKILKALKK